MATASIRGEGSDRTGLRGLGPAPCVALTRRAVRPPRSFGYSSDRWPCPFCDPPRTAENTDVEPVAGNRRVRIGAGPAYACAASGSVMLAFLGRRAPGRCPESWDGTRTESLDSTRPASGSTRTGSRGHWDSSGSRASSQVVPYVARALFPSASPCTLVVVSSAVARCLTVRCAAIGEVSARWPSRRGSRPLARVAAERCCWM